MPRLPPTEGSDRRHVELSTLIALARSLPEYLAPSPHLAPESFARIAEIDASRLPRIERLAAPGGRLGYRHYRAAGARVSMVLIHGSGCFGDLFHRMAAEIAAAGRAHVFTLNMRGHGFSDGASGHGLAGPAQAVADVSAFLRHVRERTPGCKLILAGHSAGAGPVLRAAAAGCAIDGYVFLAPCLGLTAPANRRQFGGWVKPRLLPLAAAVTANLFGVRALNGRTVVDFNCGPAKDHRYAASWSFDTLDAFTPPWRWRRLRLPPEAPVLVLALEDDECFDPRAYPMAFDELAPHASIPRLGRGGHWDLLVDDLAIETLGEWLAERAPARARPRSRRAAARALAPA